MQDVSCCFSITSQGRKITNLTRAVCAYQLEGKIGSTKLIRSYKRPHADENERQISCQIWEAARATSAAPTYFAPTIIDQHSFIDGGFGSNNPSLVGFKEIQSIFRTVAPQEVLPKPLIVSIGSGILKNENISKSSSRTATAKITDIGRSLITDTQKANADLKAIADLQIEYFRFEVESGLEDIAFDTWKVDKQNERVNFVTLETIKQATYEYLSRKEVVEALEECARLLVYRLISKACPGRHHRLEQGTLNVPFSRNPSFVGRASILNHVNELLGTYHQAALVGPPGIG